MLVPEVRIVLLRQHDDIRLQISRVRAEIARVESTRIPLATLRACLRGLDAALSEHNQHEEGILGGELRARSKGPLRLALMTNRHQREHDHLQHALAQAALLRDARAGIRIVERLLEEIEDHMRAEEQELFLGLAGSESAA